MDITGVFTGVTDPSVVAQTLADFMYENSDKLTPEEVASLYSQMYSLGVPEPQQFVATTPMHLFGWPSMTA